MNRREQMQITPATMVSELLEAYPELEDRLIEKAPIFQKLKNPKLRESITKVMSLKQAATIGNLSIGVLINELRNAAGLDELKIKGNNPADRSEIPSWINKDKIKLEYDATIDLENGIHPVSKVTKEILQLEEEDIYLLVTPFVPAPLIQIVEEKGFESFTEQAEGQRFNTYIKMK